MGQRYIGTGSFPRLFHGTEAHAVYLHNRAKRVEQYLLDNDQRLIDGEITEKQWQDQIQKSYSMP